MYKYGKQMLKNGDPPMCDGINTEQPFSNSEFCSRMWGVPIGNDDGDAKQ